LTTIYCVLIFRTFWSHWEGTQRFVYNYLLFILLKDLYPHENTAGTEFTGQAVSMVSSVNMQLFQLMGQTQTNLSVLRQEYVWNNICFFLYLIGCHPQPNQNGMASSYF
jgi:hypothetical protein